MQVTGDNRGWPTWAWMIVILQVATLVLVIVPWFWMMGAMMSGSMMMPFGMPPNATMHPTSTPSPSPH